MDEAKRVLEAYGTIVYRVCLVKLTGFDPTLADDAYQNTFLCWIEHPPKQLEPGSEHERAWFIRCAMHRCTDLIRRNKPCEEIPETFAECGESGTNEVMDALLSLPENYRMPLYLCAVCGYSADEAARMLGLTAANLRLRLTRARRALAKKLNLTEYLPEESPKTKEV